MDAEACNAHVERINRDGYTVVPDAIEVDLLDELTESLAGLEHDLNIRPATNSFEGASTLRVYNLLAYDEVWQRVSVHDAILPIVERILDPGCLISSLSSVNIGPGETAQPIHADDMLIPIPKPHPPTVCNSMWALTDFTDDNGATRIIPGTHLFDHSPNYGQHYDSIAAVMPRGSVLIWHGSLWHGGGANQTNERRIGIAMNYCAGYIRQQENQQLGLSPARVKTFPRRLQELVGYGIYNGLIGHIDKKAPADVLLGGDSPSLVWDAV